MAVETKSGYVHGQAISRTGVRTRSVHMTDAWTIYHSPLGPLTLIGGSGRLSALYFPGRSGPLAEERRDPEALVVACDQLEEYFAGIRARFELALDLGGTAFQRRVWAELIAIPFGATISYRALANAIGRPDRVRAVGATVGRTPVPIVVPCHRVIGANGELTGYGGGLQRKQALLDLEAAVAGGDPPPAVWRGRQLAML